MAAGPTKIIRKARISRVSLIVSSSSSQSGLIGQNGTNGALYVRNRYTEQGQKKQDSVSNNRRENNRRNRRQYQLGQKPDHTAKWNIEVRHDNLYLLGFGIHQNCPNPPEIAGAYINPPIQHQRMFTTPYVNALLVDLELALRGVS